MVTYIIKTQQMKKIILICFAIVAIASCKKVEKENIVTEEIIKDTIFLDVSDKPMEKSVKQVKEELPKKGFKTFYHVDKQTKDTILMQQYYMAFLKNGTIRSQNEEDAEISQEEHVSYLTKMYELGYADISGSFEDKGDIQGITIYNVPTQKMADSLANADPMVKAGRLVVEIHPWWAAKGRPLR